MNPKRVLLTGASGFLGGYIQEHLRAEGYEVITLGRNNTSIPCDLASEVPFLPGNLDFVVHAAGKAHSVPKTKADKEAFYQVNYQGTLHLLEALQRSGASVGCLVFISTVGVYGLHQGSLLNENTPLNATDPYGKSKIMAEEAVQEFCQAHQIKTCILRLPLIAGKIAPGNLGAMIKAIKKGWYLSIGKGEVKKSIVMAEDVAGIIPKLFDHSGIYNLTDGYHPGFAELEKAIAGYLGKKKPRRIPKAIAGLMAKTGDILGKKAPINTQKLRKIQSELTFSDAKAVAELGWNPLKVIDHMDKVLG